MNALSLTQFVLILMTRVKMGYKKSSLPWDNSSSSQISVPKDHLSPNKPDSLEKWLTAELRLRKFQGSLELLVGTVSK